MALQHDVTVYTNSIPVCALGLPDGAKIHLIGGELRVPSQSLVGGLGMGWLSHLHFDMALIGASGLHPEEGASATSMEEAAMKQAAVARAEQTILVCDSYKWDHPASVNFSAWEKFDCWVGVKRSYAVIFLVRKRGLWPLERDQKTQFREEPEWMSC